MALPDEGWIAVAQIDVGHDLLLGLLALQMDFVARADLIRATRAWVGDKQKPLAQILVEQGALSAVRRALLEPLVREHLEAHGDDLQRSLAAVGSIGPVRHDLERIADPDIDATLTYVAPTRRTESDVEADGSRAAGTPTAAGRFRILRPHASGGLGEVSVAFDRELGREVALKEIRPHRADDPDSRARFLLEAEITGGLEHPGIVPVYGLGASADGRPYYAMRLIRGDSLKQAIDRFHREETPDRDPGQRALALRKLLGHFVAVCNAVAYAHSRGVLHRDLKPSNVMLGPYGETLVVDWGLAKVVGAGGPDRDAAEATLQPASSNGSCETQSGSALGTPAYMSPEQAAGQVERIGPASDIYSLGATLYYLLTGRAPFADSDVAEVLRWVQQGAFRPPRQVQSRVPPALEAICRKAMALGPEDRYASPRALADDLEHWLADEPVSAYREPWPARLARRARRHRAATTAGVALLVTALAALSTSTVLIRQEQARTERQREEARWQRDRAEANFAEVRRQREEALRQRDRAEASFAEALRQREEALRQRDRAEETFAEAYRQREEALRQRDRAEENFRQARQAVDNYLTRVSESELLNVPGAQPLRRELLEAALKYYQGFLQQRGDDPELQAELAASYQRIAKITDLIGSKEEALTAYQKARALHEELIGDHPAAPQYRRELAVCLHGIGTLQADLGRRPAALRSLQRARAIQEELAQDRRATTQFQSDLALTSNTIGRLQAEAGDRTDALHSFQQARAIQEELVRGDSSVTPYQRDLALTYNSIGRLQVEAGDRTAALDSFQRVREIREKLARNHPTVAQFQCDLALIYNNIGRLQSDLGRQADARRSLEQALTIQEKLARSNPAVNQFQSHLALIYNNIGRLQAETGERSRALLSLQQACDIRKRLARENPTFTQYQSDLADSFNNLGRLQAEAGQQAEALLPLQQACEIYEKLIQDDPGNLDHRSALGMASENRGAALVKLGRLQEAVAAFRKAIDHQSVALAKAPQVIPYRQLLTQHYRDLARVQRSLGRLDEAKAAEASAAALERK